MCKRREKCGSVSSSSDSQNAREIERERKKRNHPILGQKEAALPLEEGWAAPGSLGLSRHLLGDRWIEMSNVFPKVEVGHKDGDTDSQKGHLVPSEWSWLRTRGLRAYHYLTE